MRPHFSRQFAFPMSQNSLLATGSSDGNNVCKMNVIDEIRNDIAEFEEDHGKKPARMWLTRRDKSEIARLTTSEFALAGRVAQQGVEAAVTKLFGVPIAGWASMHRDFQLTDTRNGVTVTTVRARIADWVRRLNRLFDQLERWAADVPNARVERDEIDQSIEEMMERFKVHARRIPTLTVFVGRNRIAFVPSALWISGANGRVNVTTNYRQYALVDMGGVDGQPSRWSLVTSNAKLPLVPLDQALFEKLLAERA